MKLNKRRAIAGFEVVIMIASLFAFSYFICASEDIFRKLKEPLIPVVSAEQVNTTLEDGSILTENITRTVFSISSNEFGAGCCSLAIDGQKCATATETTCSEGAFFAEGALCSATSFCRKGCCYDENAGIYDKNVLKSDCPKSWVNDPNCNMPGARLGCCILGANSIFETEGQCRVDTLNRALGYDEVVDWNSDVNEAQCLMLSATQNEGACVLAEKNCKFGTEVDCLNYGGQFNEGYLCTSPSLNTSCEITEETTCIEGKDGVYFLDSCGNYANIYDSSKLNNVNYWDRVISSEESCNSGNNGNANSKSCGNCNRFLGGICASASEENFNVD
ncbi:MAG: hypothetical protein KAR20_01845, partial [Candidatus Heimdallarchaeota archaeon]|nr:hypothetical protein [Candidatus Heimdallarchaeota archaeon]